MRLLALSLLIIPLMSPQGRAQLNLPYYVQLPADDFVWTWGRPTRNDERVRPGFEASGNERNFYCTLTGSFRLGSRMRDFYETRDFEHELNTTLDFIQVATYRLNDLDRANHLQWATLNCVIPDSETSEEKTDERLQRALERAERARERRREREEDD